MISLQQSSRIALLAATVLVFQGCSTYSERKAIAGSPSTPANTLRTLADDDEGIIRSLVASNPNTDEATLFHLAQFPTSAHATLSNKRSSTRVLERAMASVRAAYRTGAILSLLKHPAVTSGLIDQIVNMPLPHKKVMMPIAQHPLTSSAALDTLVREGEWNGSDGGHYPVVAANSNTAPATLEYLATGATDEDVELISALALRSDLPFNGQWALMQTDFSPWMRQRLLSYRAIDQHIDRLVGKSTEVWRLQLERHSSSGETRARVANAVEKMDRSDVVEHQRLVQAVAVRGFLNNLKIKYSAAKIDFHQYIRADNEYVGQCPSVRVVVEGIRFVIQRSPDEKPIEFELNGKGPPGGFILCESGSSQSSKRKNTTWYNEVEMERVRDNVQRVLRGNRLESVFNTAYMPVEITDTNSFLSWSELGEMYGWKGSEGDPKLRILAGPENSEIRTNYHPAISSHVIGRVLIDNIIVDGHITYDQSGMRFGRSTRIFREWPQ